MPCPRILKYGGIFFLGLYTANFLYEKPQIPSVKCEKGIKYAVNNVEDLIRLIPELECLFRGGVTPSKVPSGAMPGDTISMGNEGLGFFRPLATSLWKGKYISSSVEKCKGTTTKQIGWNSGAGGIVSTPFVAFISPLKDVLNTTHPSLLDNSKASLIFQYDLTQLDCPDLQPGDIKRAPFDKQLYPFHRVVDELRLVGRQKDGGAVLLGRGLLRDVYDEPSTFVPFFFFTLISYDKELNPDFRVGQPLPPLPQDTTHVLVDRRDFYRTLCSFDDLLKNPPRTLTKIMHELKIISFNTLNAIPELLWDLLSSGSDSQAVKSAFENLPIGQEYKNPQPEKPAAQQKTKKSAQDSVKPTINKKINTESNKGKPAPPPKVKAETPKNSK